MRNKIFLYGVGLALVSSGFLLYRHLIRQDALNWRRPETPPAMPLVELKVGGESLFMESRSAEGRLEYTLTSGPWKPQPKGEYDMVRPEIRFFGKDGRLILVTSDFGKVFIDQLGGFAGKQFPRSGRLSGHVVMTMGPEGSFVAGSQQLRAGQLQAHLDNDVDFDYQQRTLTSPGGIHVRSEQAAFDGENLSVAFNTSGKRIEYLRIDRGDRIVIRQVAKLMGKQSNTPATPATLAAPAAAVPPAAPVVLVAPTSSASKGAPVLTMVAPSTPAATVPVTAYRLAFGQGVKAVLGNFSLTSDQLALIFQATDKEVAKATGAPVSAPAPAPAGAASTTAPVSNPTSAAAVDAPESAAAPVKPADANAPVGPEDLVLTWTGPMEMRPMSETPVFLGPKDVILEALAAEKLPVVMSEQQANGKRWAKAARLYYHTAEEQLSLGAQPQQPVDMDDPATGHLTCQGLELSQAKGLVNIAGPARLEALAAVTGRSTPGSAPLRIDCRDRMELKLALGKNGKMLKLGSAEKTGGSKGPLLERARLFGDVEISDATMQFHAQELDLEMVPTGLAKEPQTLKHLLATGEVLVHLLKASVPSDSLAASRLEILTSEEKGLHHPRQLLADGRVVATTYQSDKETAKPQRQKLTCEHLVADLEAKANKDGSVRMSSFAPATFEATEGVAVELEGYGEPVMARATKLVAQVKAATAQLYGAPGDAPLWASVGQGVNVLRGRTILVERARQRVEVPGEGVFDFQVPGKDQAPQVVKMTWAKNMEYLGREHRAEFAGPIRTTLLGRADQQGELNCRQMTVRMDGAKGAKGAKSAEMPMGGKISEIIADGEVIATGMSLDPQGQMLTRLWTQTAKLIYHPGDQSMQMPQAGKLLVEDHRPEAIKATTSPASGSWMSKGSSRGETAFSWQKQLQASASHMAMEGEVKMVHKPSQPLRRLGKNAPASSESGFVKLACQMLTAEMSGSKATPFSMGDGGGLKRVQAQNQVLLELDQDRLSADLLDFDPLNHLAVAEGKDGNAATAFRVDGPGVGSADRIEWDLSRQEGGFKLIRPRGTMEAPPLKEFQ